MTLSYTPRFHLAVPDFLSEPWHAEFAAAMESIDQALFTAIVAQETNAWLNDHAYAVGDLIIDPATGTLYSCAVAHTSTNATAAPTFADEFAAHPTYWTSFAVIAASQTEAELGVDNNKYMTPLRTAQAITAQSPTPGIATQAQAQEGTNNTEVMTPLRTAQNVTARIATQAQAVAGTDNTALMTPLRTEQLIVSAGVAGGDSVGFSAHKGGTTQNFVAATWTKVTFGVELYDFGSFYDTANSRWTPPSGQVNLICGVDVTNHSVDTFVALSIYKNGGSFRSVNLYSPSTAAGVPFTISDFANGTDYYELWAYIPSGGVPTIPGGVGTFFMGSFLGEVGVVTIGLAEVGFRASKGGTAQPGFPNATWTKISFGTEEYDQGGFYDNALSRWIPSSGMIHLDCSVVASGAIAVGGTVGVAIYKNGAQLKYTIDTASSGSVCGCLVSVDDVASGTDYYEAFAYVQTGGATSIDGTAGQTWFSGHRIKGAQGETGPTGATGPTGSTVSPSINCGRLRYVSPTQLSFTPFNGGHIKINGVLLPIPTSGIVGLANTGVYVNGVAGQPLAAGQPYYVYAFMNAGVMTADFSVTGHVTSNAISNEGTEIKSGDNTRTLIGLIRTANGATTFIDNPTNRYVLSWFNRRARPIQGPGTNIVIGVGSWTTLNGAAYCYFLTWGDESCSLNTNGYCWPNDTGAQGMYGGMAIDQLSAAGAGLLSYTYVVPSLQWSAPIAVNWSGDLGEGFHAFYPAAYCNAYTGYFNIWLSGTIQG